MAEHFGVQAQGPGQLLLAMPRRSPMSVDHSQPDAQLYTVASGDTLSKIARQFYGNANSYMKIFEAVARADFDSEDIVTDLINRAEFSLEEARKKGDTMVALASPKI